MPKRGKGESTDYPKSYEAVAVEISETTKLVLRMAVLSTELDQVLSEIEPRLEKIKIAMYGDFPFDDTLLGRILDRIPRKRELRNMEELGSFGLEARRALDDAWKRLP